MWVKVEECTCWRAGARPAGHAPAVRAEALRGEEKLNLDGLRGLWRAQKAHSFCSLGLPSSGLRISLAAFSWLQPSLHLLSSRFAWDRRLGFQAPHLHYSCLHFHRIHRASRILSALGVWNSTTFKSPLLGPINRGLLSPASRFNGLTGS